MAVDPLRTSRENCLVIEAFKGFTLVNVVCCQAASNIHEESIHVSADKLQVGVLQVVFAVVCVAKHRRDSDQQLRTCIVHNAISLLQKTRGTRAELKLLLQGLACELTFALEVRLELLGWLRLGAKIMDFILRESFSRLSNSFYGSLLL